MTKEEAVILENARELVLSLYKEQEELEGRISTSLKALQDACPHESAVQYIPYYEGKRICLYCGLEENWTYDKLRNSIVVKETSNIHTFAEYRTLQPVTKITYPLIV